MQENIELGRKIKVEFKSLAAKNQVTMKDWLLSEAKNIIDNNETVHRTEREDDRDSLIIKVPEDLKLRIKDYCEQEDVRIRDFWVECVNRLLVRYNNE